MGKPSINGPFSIAMLNNQRVSWDGCYNSDLFDREPDIIRLQQVAEAIDIYLLFGVAEVSHAECIEPPLVVGRGFKHGRIDGWITYFETGERWGKMGKDGERWGKMGKDGESLVSCHKSFFFLLFTYWCVLRRVAGWVAGWVAGKITSEEMDHSRKFPAFGTRKITHHSSSTIIHHHYRLLINH